MLFGKISDYGDQTECSGWWSGVATGVRRSRVPLVFFKTTTKAMVEPLNLNLITKLCATLPTIHFMSTFKWVYEI